MKNFIIGIALTFLSGVFPLIYLFADQSELNERYFGFKTMYGFWFASGNHISIALFVIGTFFIVNNLSSKNRKQIYYICLLSPLATSFLLTSWDLSPSQLPVSLVEYYAILIVIFCILVILVFKTKTLLSKESLKTKIHKIKTSIKECTIEVYNLIDEIENIEAYGVESDLSDDINIWKSVLQDSVNEMYLKSDVLLKKLQKNEDN
ncbi:hypothetical protein [Tenacibaculum sp. C7A-26P2]|uniref:hypothetical protein n=1 Tax=Tenacibaculum sp. C7A-26P2 TaxID=3447504 RepID=UPI003F84CC74